MNKMKKAGVEKIADSCDRAPTEGTRKKNYVSRFVARGTVYET
jgi:hypothetical protein